MIAGTAAWDAAGMEQSTSTAKKDGAILRSANRGVRG
jgi:hypothetical protein